MKKIILSTDDESILDFAASLHQEKIVLHRRSAALSSNLAKTDDLVAHALEISGGEHILWTHVTSPFVTSEIYDKMILQYFSAMREGYDSLMTVNQKQGFFWNSKGPLNYDRRVEKWPRTQTLVPLYEVNSAAFIASTDIYRLYNDRIGVKPWLYVNEEFEGFDIDWPMDFKIAELLLTNNLMKILK